MRQEKETPQGPYRRAPAARTHVLAGDGEESIQPGKQTVGMIRRLAYDYRSGLPKRIRTPVSTHPRSRYRRAASTKQGGPHGAYPAQSPMLSETDPSGHISHL